MSRLRLLYQETATDWHAVISEPAQNVPRYELFTKEITKPEIDDRDYKCIRLENGLEALLIHDANADKSAASLDVEVGHLHDPDDLPGLAHFCEHLLFLGTEQFPKENDYSQYISRNGGHTNAFTSAHNTNYHFDVSATALPGALSRFASFFHSPLFNQSCTSRELNAVDSENKKNQQSDIWRLHQLNKHLSKPGHPWTKFGSGNRESLTAASRHKVHLGLVSHDSTEPSAVPQAPPPDSSEAEKDDDGDGGAVGQETRRRLVEWWAGHYSSERMKLVVLGKESLDELSMMVAREFSAIKNRGIGRTPLMLEDPRGDKDNGILVYAKTVMDFRAVDISWSCEWQPPNYLSKPSRVLGHLLGHEGPGSIHAYLKNKGWISHLSAGIYGGGRGFSFFKILIVLTKDGMDHYTEVLLVVYKYLEFLRRSEVPVYVYDEIKSIAESRFRFTEKRSEGKYVSSLAERLSCPYPRDLVLCADNLIWEWDKSALRDLLDTLSVERSRVILMAKEGLPEGDWTKEKWYQSEYWTEDLPATMIEQVKDLRDFQDMYIPKPNEFIPKNFDVVKVEVQEPLKRPMKLTASELSTVWHKKDDQFWVPKAHVMLRLLNPLINATPRHSLLSRLFTDLVKDALAEFTYDAELAGMKYSITNSGNSIIVTSQGYNDKLPVLLRYVLEKTKNIVITQDRVTVATEQLRQEIENFYLDQPYSLCDYYAMYLLRELSWTPKEKLAELDYVRVDDIQRHAQDILSRSHITMLVHGNIGSEEALQISDSTEAILNARPISFSEKTLPRSLVLPPACNYIWESVVPNKEDSNSSITYFVEVGDSAEPNLRAVLSLFGQMISEPAFNQLRTKEQLGYVVSSGVWLSTGSAGWRIVVQSERKPRYLESRIDNFLDLFRETLSTMLDSEFERQRDSYALKRLEKPKNPGEEASRFWTHIDSGYEDFLRRETDANNVRQLTRENIISFFNEHIHYGSLTRRKLSVHLTSQKKAHTRFSVKASEELLEILKAEGIPVEEEQYRQLSAAQPPLEAVVKFWTDHLSGHESAAFILPRIPTISSQYAIDGEEAELDFPVGATCIRDIAAFKASLTASQAPIPVQA